MLGHMKKNGELLQPILKYDNQTSLYAINSQNISVKSCIKGVYLGARMKKNIKEHIKEICRNKLNNTPVYSTKLSKNKYELDFIPEGEQNNVTI